MQKYIARDYQHVDGTSFAAPIVASIAAQMLEANPKLSPKDVRAGLLQTARKLDGVSPEIQGAGLVDASAAVALGHRGHLSLFEVEARRLIARARRLQGIDEGLVGHGADGVLHEARVALPRSEAVIDVTPVNTNFHHAARVNFFDELVVRHRDSAIRRREELPEREESAHADDDAGTEQREDPRVPLQAATVSF